MSKEITRIKDNEEIKLRTLLEQANKSDDNSDWQAYMDYMKELGELYSFDPRQVQINTKGVVSLLPDATIWVVHNKETGEIITTSFSKKKAYSYLTQGTNVLKDIRATEATIE